MKTGSSLNNYFQRIQIHKWYSKLAKTISTYIYFDNCYAQQRWLVFNYYAKYIFEIKCQRCELK